MKALGRYDGTLQMFVQEPREADTRHLQFLRWLVEQGELANDITGPVDGVYLNPAAEGPNTTPLAEQELGGAAGPFSPGGTR